MSFKLIKGRPARATGALAHLLLLAFLLVLVLVFVCAAVFVLHLLLVFVFFVRKVLVVATTARDTEIRWPSLQRHVKNKLKKTSVTLYLLPCFDLSRSFSFLRSFCLCSFLNLSLWCLCESDETDLAGVKAEKQKLPSCKHSTHREGIKAQNKPWTCTTL